MALEVGAVYASAGVRVDDSGFARYERRLRSAREDARRPVKADARLDVDQRGGNLWRRLVRTAHTVADRPVKADARLDVDESGFRRFRRDMDDGERHASRFSTGVRGSFGLLRVGVAGAAAGAGASVGLLGIKVVQTASDINESLTKNQVLFGRYATDVERFSKTSAASFGISRSAALQYTGTFGNLFRALDVAPKKSATLSVSLTKLAADLASFNNTSPEDALEALRSGLVGEVEPLRAFGVNLNDAQLRQEAMHQGLTKNTKNVLTPYQRSMAAVALITKQTATAHGDFARTSSGLANQTRILKGRLSDMGAELGAKLLPFVVKAAHALNGFLDQMHDRTGAGGKFVRFLERARDAIGDFIDQMQDRRGTGGKFVGFLETTRDVAKSLFGVLRDGAGLIADHADEVKLAAAAWAAVKIGGKLQALRGLGRGGAAGGPVPVFVTNPGFGRGGPGGGGGPVPLPGGGAAGEEAGRFARIRGVLRTGAKFAGKVAALDFAINLVTSRGNPIGAVVNTAHDLTFGIVPKIKIPTASDRQDKQLAAMAKRIEDAFNAPSSKPLRDARHELALMAAEADRFGDHKLAQQFRDLEGNVRRTSPAFKGSRQELRELNAKVDDARGKFRAAKAPLQDLKKGTDEYRQAAKIAAARQGDLTDAIKHVRSAQAPAARTFATIAGSVAGMGQVVADSIDSVGGNVNNVLKDLGAKGLRYTIKHPKKAGHDAGALAGALGNLFATGGIPHPGSGARDDHILIDPSGRPVAAMSGTEGILNTPQMAEVDEALAIKRALGLGQFGGLADLWGSGMRHFAGGGSIEAVPGFPGERAAARVIPLIEQIAHRFHLTLTDAYGQGHKSPGHTKYGTAADFAGPDRNMDRAVAALVRAGYLVGYDGRFGSQAWPGHGPTSVAGGNAHLHVELGGKGGNLGAGIADIARRVIAGPAGPLRTIAQRSSDRVVDAANAFVTRKAGAALAVPTGGGGAPDAGVVSGFRRAMGDARANSVERLAGWEAGIVESGLRNLPYGDRDSVGALQQRPSAGWHGLMNPYRAMLEFLSHAKRLRPWRGSAGRLAQAVQGSAYPGRYDAVAGQARAYLARGGRLRRFNGGGSLGGRNNLGGPPSDEFSNPNPGTRLSVKSLRGVAGDRIESYNAILKDVDRERKHYEQADRKYNQSDEVLIDPDTGELNQAAIEKRAGELGRLKKIREHIASLLKRAERKAESIRKTYATIIERLRRSLRHAKKKDRSGIRAQIKGYKAKRAAWLTTIRDDIRPDLVDARLDVGDIDKEGAELRGTKAEPRDTGGDTGGDTAGDTTADNPNLQAIADQATARADALAADLATARQNLAVFGGPGDLGVGGKSAFAAGTFAGALGTDQIANPYRASGVPATAPGGGFNPHGGPVGNGGRDGLTVNVNVHSFVPPSGAEQQRLAGVVVGALGAQGAVPVTRERVP